MSPRFDGRRRVRWDTPAPSRSRPYKYKYERKPGKHALHLRWLDEEVFNAIRAAARYRNMRIVTFVSDILGLYLKGGQSHEVGICEVCRRRAALSGPTKVQGKVKKMTKAKRNDDEGKTEEATRKGKCRHFLLTTILAV